MIATAGHEIGAHGYSHENPVAMTRQQEEDVLKKSIELIEKFSLDRVNSSPASHDQDKLFWIEGEWMKRATRERKVQGVLPFLAREGLVAAVAGSGPDSLRRVKTIHSRVRVVSAATAIIPTAQV